MSRNGGAVHVREDDGVLVLENDAPSSRNQDLGSGDFVRPAAVRFRRQPRRLSEQVLSRFERAVMLRWYFVTIVIIALAVHGALQFWSTHQKSQRGRIYELIYKVHVTHEGLKEWAATKTDQKTAECLMLALDELYRRHIEDMDKFKWLIQFHVENSTNNEIDCGRVMKNIFCSETKSQKENIAPQE